MKKDIVFVLAALCAVGLVVALNVYFSTSNQKIVRPVVETVSVSAPEQNAPATSSDTNVIDGSQQVDPAGRKTGEVKFNVSFKRK